MIMLPIALQEGALQEGALQERGLQERGLQENVLSERYAHLVDVVCNIAEGYFYAGRLSDAVRVLDHGIQITNENNDVHAADHARLLIQYGRMLNWTSLMGHNCLDQAASALHQALHIAELLANETLQAYAMLHLGNMLDFQKLLTAEGDWGEALRILQQAYELFLKTADKAGQGNAIFFRGLVYQRLGQNDEAITHFRQARDLARQNADKFAESEAIRHLGAFAFMAGNLDDAYQHARESLRLFEEIDCQIALSSAYHVLGVCQSARDELPQALASYQKAVAMAEALNLGVPLIQARLALGSLYTQKQVMDKAMACVAQANKVAQETQYPRFINATSSKLAELSQ